MLHQDTLYQELLFILKSKDTDYAKLLFDHISLCSFVIKFALITLDYCCSAKGDKWNLVWSISRKHTSSKCQKTLAHKIYIHWDHSGSLFPGNVKQPEINQKELCQAYFWIFGKKLFVLRLRLFFHFVHVLYEKVIKAKSTRDCFFYPCWGKTGGRGEMKKQTIQLPFFIPLNTATPLKNLRDFTCLLFLSRHTPSWPFADTHVPMFLDSSSLMMIASRL